MGLHADLMLSRASLSSSTPSRDSVRVAILHDHLRFIGGGERVALSLAAALDADLYVTDLDPTLPERAGMRSVRASQIAEVPQKAPRRQDAQARAFRKASIPDHDVYVFSGNWAVFAAPRFRPNIWYCHTPVRVFYDLRASFLESRSPVQGWFARRWIARRRPEYEAAVREVQTIVANSRNVASRIERYLGRKSEVVHPPVETSRYRFDRIGETWLAVNRLSHEKRINLLVETFRRLPNERLIVAGGPQMGDTKDRFVRALRPPPNVEFLGEIPEARLTELYATSRGLVATSRDEDFGMTAVEAMASGKVVIAVDEGGYRETVLDGDTGWLVPPRAETLAQAIEAATPDRLQRMRLACQAHARLFDVSRFTARMHELVLRAASSAEAASRSQKPSH